MGRSITTIKSEISKLQTELLSVQPCAALTVRELAHRAGISPATAHRFKTGKAFDIPTAKKLIESGLLDICPCCGREGGE